MTVRTVAAMLAFAILVTITGCFARARPQLGVLKSRAALDMRCDNLMTYPVADNRTFVVRGCGQEAVYVHTCQTLSSNYGAEEVNCTWQLDRGPTPLTPVLTSAAVR